MAALTVLETADLLGVSVITVKRHIWNNDFSVTYVPGVGRGGRQLRILLESLPQEAQDKYNGVVQTSEEEPHPYLTMTDTQREAVAFKHCVVLEYQQFKEEYSGLDKMKAFLSQYNSEHPEKMLSKRQLNHWENKYNRLGIKGLLDGRGGYNKGQSEIRPEVWDMFKRYWLNESRPTVSQCVKLTAFEFPEEAMPSIVTFRRQIDRQIPLPAQCYYREGKKAYEDRFSPYNIRDYSKYHSNDWWIADHHIFDVAVLDSRGKVCRPWLSAWEDLHSRMIVGYALNTIDPNSDIVLDSFARACCRSGIPDNIKIDNGKDYKAFDLFNSEFSMSVCNEMGIHVSCALPYNAKAKPIERLFGTLEQEYCKHLSTYLSNDPKTRPTEMRKLNEQLKDKAIPIEEFKVIVDNLIKTYNTEPHSSLGGKTPLEAYSTGFVKPMRVVVGRDTLNMFLMRTSKPLTVGRNGIRVPDLFNYYTDDALFPYIGQKVYARYNADDVRTVCIFTESNDFVCIASCIELCDFGGDSPVKKEQIRELQRRKQARHKMVRAQMPDIEPKGIESYLAKKAERYADFEPDKTSIAFNPVKHRHAEEIAAAQEKASAASLPEMQKQKKQVANGMDEQMIDDKLFELMTGGFSNGQD